MCFEVSGQSGCDPQTGKTSYGTEIHHSRIRKEKHSGVNYCYHQGCQHCGRGITAKHKDSSVEKVHQERLNIKETIFSKEVIWFEIAVFIFIEVCSEHFEVTDHHRKIQKEWPQRTNMTLNCAGEQDKMCCLEAPCPSLSISIGREGECLRQRLQPKSMNQKKLRWCTMALLLELTVQREKDFFKE